MSKCLKRVNYRLIVISIITILSAKNGLIFGQCNFEWGTANSGMNNYILAMTVYKGELIAGGAFTQADGGNAKYIARWNGAAWQPLGSGTNGIVSALTVYNGDLIVGGNFSMAGGVFTNKVARWNGNTGSSIGS